MEQLFNSIPKRLVLDEFVIYTRDKKMIMNGLELDLDIYKNNILVEYEKPWVIINPPGNSLSQYKEILGDFIRGL